MELIKKNVLPLQDVLLTGAVLFGIFFAMVVIVYGADSVAPGVHDAFHDFRHSIGFACH